MDQRSVLSAAADLRASLRAYSTPAEELPGPAAQVFDRLVHQTIGGSASQGFLWELRISNGLAENAFSLPNGGVYVDEKMAQTLGNEPGLWAALLAHEIVHITERHWTKRVAFQNSVKDSLRSWNQMQLGALPVTLRSTSPSQQASEFAEFSRELERDADLGSLDILARSGFHPDFVIALFHLMEAQEGSGPAQHFLASHPGWDVRESVVRKRYAAAVSEFERLWPRAGDSPGGNAPVLAFMGRPQARSSASHQTAEVSLPLRCEHTTNPVEVVLVFRRLRSSDVVAREQEGKLQRTIACTSTQARVSFALDHGGALGETEVEFYVMDDRGWVLGHSLKLRAR